MRKVFTANEEGVLYSAIKFKILFVPRFFRYLIFDKKIPIMQSPKN